MKTKNLNSVLILITLIIFLGSCKDGQKPEGTTTTPKPRPKEVDMKILEPHLVPIDTLAKWQQYYVDTRASILEKALGKDDVRAVTFSKESLRAYLDYLDANSKDSSDMGIRVYFATYPANTTDPKAVPDQTTVFMVPVTAKGTIANGIMPMAPNYAIQTGSSGYNYGSGCIPPKGCDL